MRLTVAGCDTLGRVLELVLANLIAVTHLFLIGVMLAGGLLAWRWPRMLWLHVPCAMAILAVNLLGADCPLTTMELALRVAGGQPSYDGGFISHYLIEPWHPQGITATVRRVIYGIAIVPNVIAYAGLLARRLRRPDTDGDLGSVGQPGKVHT